MEAVKTAQALRRPTRVTPPRGDNARIAPSTLRRRAPLEAPRDESIGMDGL